MPTLAYRALSREPVNSLLSADSAGRYYNGSIKGQYDCRIHPVPQYRPNEAAFDAKSGLTFLITHLPLRLYGRRRRSRHSRGPKAAGILDRSTRMRTRFATTT